MACNFDLPSIPLRVPGLSLPALPQFPDFAAINIQLIELGLPGVSLPSIPIRIPGLALPAIPQIPNFSVDLDLPGVDLDLPSIPFRVPGLSLPPLPQFPSLSIPCPFE